jgi:hypothetical protein
MKEEREKSTEDGRRRRKGHFLKKKICREALFIFSFG